MTIFICGLISHLSKNRLQTKNPFSCRRSKFRSDTLHVPVPLALYLPLISYTIFILCIKCKAPKIKLDKKKKREKSWWCKQKPSPIEMLIHSLTVRILTHFVLAEQLCICYAPIKPMLFVQYLVQAISCACMNDQLWQIWPCVA